MGELNVDATERLRPLGLRQHSSAANPRGPRGIDVVSSRGGYQQPLSNDPTPAIGIGQYSGQGSKLPARVFRRLAITEY